MIATPVLSGFATFGLALWIALGPAVPPTDKDGPTSADPPCDAPEARAFDFWLGEWSITQKILTADGSWITLPAKTTVTRGIERWRRLLGPPVDDGDEPVGP